MIFDYLYKMLNYIFSLFFRSFKLIIKKKKFLKFTENSKKNKYLIIVNYILFNYIKKILNFLFIFIFKNSKLIYNKYLIINISRNFVLETLENQFSLLVLILSYSVFGLKFV